VDDVSGLIGVVFAGLSPLVIEEVTDQGVVIRVRAREITRHTDQAITRARLRPAPHHHKPRAGQPPRPTQTCYNRKELSDQGSLRCVRDCARERWPLRGSFG